MEIILLGNKSDKEEEFLFFFYSKLIFLFFFVLNRREVTFEEGLEFAKSNGLEFLETSALTTSNVEKVKILRLNDCFKAFYEITTIIYKKIKDELIKIDPEEV